MTPGSATVKASLALISYFVGAAILIIAVAISWVTIFPDRCRDSVVSFPSGYRSTYACPFGARIDVAHKTSTGRVVVTCACAESSLGDGEAVR